MENNFSTKTVNINSKYYPKLLKSINKPPSTLYYKYKDNLSENIFAKCLAVVGSRRITDYGRQVTQDLVYSLSSLGITIVSGFMYGVDTYAHKAALAAGGKTIAVMPGGIDLITPAYQKDIYEQILLGGGLVLSEFDGTTGINKGSFPRRNRLVVGISHATLIIECELHSGTMISAQLALAFDRKLFAVPGCITEKNSEGSLLLLKESKASLVTCVADILDNVESFSSAKSKVLPSFEQLFLENNSGQHLLEIIEREPKTLSEIASMLKTAVSDVAAEVTMLELSGLVYKKGEKFYVGQN